MTEVKMLGTTGWWLSGTLDISWILHLITLYRFPAGKPSIKPMLFLGVKIPSFWFPYLDIETFHINAANLWLNSLSLHRILAVSWTNLTKLPSELYCGHQTFPRVCSGDAERPQLSPGSRVSLSAMGPFLSHCESECQSWQNKVERQASDWDKILRTQSTKG